MSIKNISVNNEKKFEEAKEYFMNGEDSIKVNNNDENLKNIEGNIYGLYVENKIMYIGERQKGKIASRLNEHFHKCPKGTKSKNEEIKDAYKDNKKVSYKTLLIEPDYERYALETYLIQNIDSLLWNVRDRGKKTVDIYSSDEDEIGVSIVNGKN